MWESRAVFARLFQAAVGIRIKKKLPKATDLFADFHSCGIFHRPFCFFFFWFFFSFCNEFPLWKTGWVALRIGHPTVSTVEGDFRTRSARGAGHMLRCCPSRTRL